MATFRDKAGPDSENAKVDNPPKPCRQCFAMTPVPTLNSYGALCGPCFAAYCRSGPTPRYREGDSTAVADMKKRLKA